MALAHTHSRCSSAVHARWRVSDASCHQEHPLGVFGGESGMFQSDSQPGGVAQLQASLTPFTCVSLYLALSPKVRSLLGVWL